MKELLLTPLDRSGGEPLYMQLYRRLSEYVLDPDVSQKRLPTEQKLMEYFGVSRNTVRQALAILADESLIARVKRRGTVVSSHLHAFDPQNPARSIGAVFPRGEWHEVRRSMQRLTEARGMSFQYYPYDWEDYASEEQAVRAARKRCSGIVLYPCRNNRDADLIDRLVAEGYPLILFDLYSENYTRNVVSIDHFTGAVVLGGYLLESGCTRIACVQRPEAELSTWLRIAGLKFALNPSRNAVLLQHEYTSDDAFLAFLRSGRPDGLFCVDDSTGPIVRILTSERGRFLPEVRDLSLVHFDNPTSAVQEIGSAAQPDVELGRASIQLLFDLLHNRVSAPRKYLIAPVFRRKKSGSEKPLK